MHGATDILAFWFADADDDTVIAPGTPPYRRWFARNPEVDAHIVETWGPAVAAARAGGHDDWCDSPAGLLALVLLLDQFPRHIWRGQAAAFASDAQALALVRAAIDRGVDEALPLCRRVFLYLPIQHSERLEDHDLALERFESLVTAATARGAKIASFCAAAVKSEVEHADTLRLFGRYPYRNAALGRDSTAEEAAWLTANGY